MSKGMRECVIDQIGRDILGPGSERLCGYDAEHEIIITEKVSDRYAVGVLYPQQEQNMPEPPTTDEDKGAGDSEDGDDEVGDSELTKGTGPASDAEYEDIAALSRAFKPSAMGMTFYASDVAGLVVEASAAEYIRVNECEGEIGRVRLPVVATEEIEWMRSHLSAKMADAKFEFAKYGDEYCIQCSDGDVSNVMRDWLDEGVFEALLDADFIKSLEKTDYNSSKKFTLEAVFKSYRGGSLSQVDKLAGLELEYPDEMKRLRALVALYVAGERLYRQRTMGWKRFPLNVHVDVAAMGFPTLPVGASAKKAVSLTNENENPVTGIELVMECLHEKPNSWRMSLSILNKYHSGSSDKTTGELHGDVLFCQPKIVCSGESLIIPTRDSRFLTKCPEDRVLEMLYRKCFCFGRGRGCSVRWKEDPNGGLASKIETTYLPTKAIKAPDWNVYPIELGEQLGKTALSADFLRKEENRTGVLESLDCFVGNYETWIDERRKEVLSDPELSKGEYKEAAASVVRNCEEAAKRMRQGIDTLTSSDAAYKAFRLANEAMHRTRQWRGSGLFKWRQFQLGFILISLSSLVNKDDPCRRTVDLLWFPTGGGKTEAYLGLTAIGIFYRYLTEENPAGTSVIMRYTLRLLASQQFSRACALICACDTIRGEDDALKLKPRITIGLWIGGRSRDNPEGLPNKIKGRESAEDIVKKLNSSKTHQVHPFQPETCPKCGRKIYDVGQRHRSGYDVSGNDFSVFCQNPDCDYHRRNGDGMPVQIIDECLYREPPTLLFGTVDKFAQLSHRDLSAKFMGLENGERVNPAPDLIIQDELHLISEELGTLVALYETAVSGLCTTCGGSAPKVVASTATVRRAYEQCSALFAAEHVAQFPPPGLDSKDSYFSKESNTDGRMYLGLESSGQTTSTTLIRLMAMLLFRANHLDIPEYEFENKSLEELDKYYTLVTYFNSLRELGACETWVNSDIYERIKGMSKREALSIRNLDPKRAAVMCSRTSSSEIKDKLEELQKDTLLTIPEKRYPQDVVLASNMLSVGLDVDRFCLMVMNGQPKKNAEFIQASSRVGRNDIDLGLVVTLYSGTKVRDRSYFELFPDYIQSFYKYVEPTTITPFTRAARERLLKPIIATLVRHIVPDFEKNDFSGGDVEDLIAKKGTIRLIVERRLDQLIACKVETEQTKRWTMQEFDEAYLELIELVKGHKVTQYDDMMFGRAPSDRVLFYSDVKGKAHWEGVSSLRHVDKSVMMELTDSED